MTYVPSSPPPSDQPNFNVGGEVTTDKSKERTKASIPTPTGPVITHGTEEVKHPPSVKVEDVSYAFLKLPKGVRNFFYSKSISEFNGKKITSEELLVKLPAVNFRTIHPASFSCLNTPGIVQELDNSQLDGLTHECLAHISDNALESLTYQQAKFLLENKLDCFDCPRKVSILISLCTDNEYRTSIAGSALQCVENTVKYLSNGSFEGSTQSEVQSIPVSIIKRNPSNITCLGDSLEYMSKDQFKMISEAHVKAMTGTQAVQYASLNMETLPKDHIPALLQKIPNAPQLTKLREHLLKKYYEGTPYAKNKELMKLDLQYISPDIIRNLPDNFMKKSIQNGVVNNISFILLKQIALEKPSILGSLGNGELSKMPRAQLLDMIAVIPKKVLDHMDNKKYIIARSLADNQVGTLSSEQLQDYVNNGIFQEFTKGQVSYAYPALLNTLGAKELEKIPLAQLKWLSPKQLQGLKPSAIGGLSDAKLVEMYSRHNEMNALQLDALQKALSSSKIDSQQKESMVKSIKDKIERQKFRRDS